MADDDLDRFLHNGLAAQAAIDDVTEAWRLYQTMDTRYLEDLHRAFTLDLERLHATGPPDHPGLTFGQIRLALIDAILHSRVT